jgi:hypothetical protein
MFTGEINIISQPGQNFLALPGPGWIYCLGGSGQARPNFQSSAWASGLAWQATRRLPGTRPGRQLWCWDSITMFLSYKDYLYLCVDRTVGLISIDVPSSTNLFGEFGGILLELTSVIRYTTTRDMLRFESSGAVWILFDCFEVVIGLVKKLSRWGVFCWRIMKHTFCIHVFVFHLRSNYLENQHWYFIS